MPDIKRERVEDINNTQTVLKLTKGDAITQKILLRDLAGIHRIRSFMFDFVVHQLGRILQIDIFKVGLSRFQELEEHRSVFLSVRDSIEGLVVLNDFIETMQKIDQS